jgi:hypothetical protein
MLLQTLLNQLRCQQRCRVPPNRHQIEHARPHIEVLVSVMVRDCQVLVLCDRCPVVQGNRICSSFFDLLLRISQDRAKAEREREAKKARLQAELADLEIDVGMVPSDEEEERAEDSD